MQHSWIEVQIPNCLDAGELLTVLNDSSFVGAWEEKHVTKLYCASDQWSPRLHDRLRNIVHRMSGTKDVVLTVTKVPHEDWNAKWAASLEPVKIGRRVIVRPSWASVELAPLAIELILDPRQAFGTGHHVTTQLLIEWLEEAVDGGERVLDVGTGSGILAMVAIRLGAGFAWGLDDDPVAVDCARSYAAVNRFGSELVLSHGRFPDAPAPDTSPFDIVVANLDRKTLVQHAEAFQPVLASTGRLFLAGLLHEDREEVRAIFHKIGARVTDIRERDGWVAMEIRFHMS